MSRTVAHSGAAALELLRRVLGDRLVDAADHAWLAATLDSALEKCAGGVVAAALRSQPMLFSGGVGDGTPYGPVRGDSLRGALEANAAHFFQQHKLHALKHADLVLFDGMAPPALQEWPIFVSLRTCCRATFPAPARAWSRRSPGPFLPWRRW